MAIQIFNRLPTSSSIFHAMIGAGALIATREASLYLSKFFTPKPEPMVPGSPAIGLKAFASQEADLISDRTFQHVLGQHFGKETKLEGNSPVVMTGHLLDFLQARIKTMKERPCVGDKDQFCRDYLLKTGENALPHFEQLERQMEVAVSLRAAFEGSVQRFSEAVAREADRLHTGESFFFQGDWVQKGMTGGHALVYEIIKEKDDRFTFRVYNGGSGVEKYHFSKNDEFKKNFNLRFTEIEAVRKEKLLSPTFLQALQELHQAPPYGENSWDADELYRALLPILEGKLSHKVYDAEQLQEAAFVGHCTYLSWSGLLHQHMGLKGNFERLEFELQLKTLHDYFIQNRSRLKGSGMVQSLHLEFLRLKARAMEFLKVRLGEDLQNAANIFESHQALWAALLSNGLQELGAWIGSFASPALDHLAMEEAGARHLTQKGAVHFARLAVDLFQKEEISEKEASYTLQMLKEIEEELDLSESKAMGVISWEGGERFTIDRLQRGTISQREIKEEKTVFQEIKTPPFSEKTLITDLEGLCQTLRTANAQGEFRGVKRAIQQFVKQIPTGWMRRGEAGFSKFLKGSQAQIISHLATLSKEYYFSIISDLGSASKLNAIEFLTQIKLYLLADALSSSPFSIPPPKTFDLILALESSSISIFDPEWNLQIGDLQSYYLSSGSPDQFYPQTLNKIRWTETWNPTNLCRGAAPFHCIKRSQGKMVYKDFIDYVQTPEILSKIQILFPEILSKDPLEQALFFLYPESDDPAHPSRQIFGADFHALRDMKFLSQLLLMARSSPSDLSEAIQVRNSKPDFNQGLVQRLHFFKNKENDPDSDFWVEERTVFGLEDLRIPSLNSHEEPGPDYLLRSGDSLSLNPSQGNLPLAEKQTFDPLAADLEVAYAKSPNIFFHPYIPSYLSRRNRFSPHERLIQKKENLNNYFKTLNVQDQRDLLALSSNPALQIQETLGYFKKRPALLKIAQYQTFFKKLMFEPGLLMDELRKGSSKPKYLSDSLASFCKEQFEFQYRFGDFSAAAYFLEISALFESHVKCAMSAFPKMYAGYSPHFLDTTRESTRLLSQEISDEVRISLELIRASSYRAKEKLEPEEIKQILSAAILIHAMPQEEVKLTEEQENYLRNKHATLTISKARQQIEEIQDLVARILPQIRSFSATEKDALLNELLRTLCPEAQAVSWSASPFPRFVSGDQRFAIDLSTGEFSEKGGALRKLPLSVRKNSLVLSISEDRETLFGIESEEGVWEFSNRKQERYRLVDGKTLYRDIEGTWHKKIFPPFRLPMPLVEKHSFWRSAGPILISGPKGWAAQIDVDLLEPPPSLHHGAPVRTAVVRRDGLILDNLMERSQPHFLETFASTEDILIWKKEKSALPDLIEIPYYGLNFRKVGKRIFSQEMKGYWISENQTAPSGIDRFLLLEDSSGKKTLLIPNGELEVKGGASLAPRYLLNKTDASPKFFRYDLTPKTITPQTWGARLHLSLLFLSHQMYEDAFSLLQPFNSYLRPFKKEEAEKLSAIAAFDKVNKDDDPRGSAVRFKAAALLLKNARDAFERGAIWKDQTYLQKKSQIPLHLRLSEEEETLLFDHLFPGSLKQKFPLKVKDTYWSLGFSPWKSPWKSQIEALLNSADSFCSALSETKNWSDFLTRTSSLLRQKAFSKNFFELYELAKAPLTQKNAFRWIELVSGTSVNSSLSLDQMKEEIEAEFRLTFLGNTDSKQKILASVLKAVLEDPQAFPSGEVVKKAVQNRDLKRVDSLILKPTLKRFQECKMPCIEDSELPAEEAPWFSAPPKPAKPTPLPFKASARITSDRWNGVPIPNLETYLKMVSPAPEKVARAKEALSRLTALFQKMPNEKVAKRKFEELQARLTEYGQKPLSAEYKIRDGADLKGLKKKLLEEADHLEKRLALEQERLVAFANRLPENEKEVLSRHLAEKSGDWKEIGFAELVLALFANDARKMQKANHALAKSEIFDLYQKTARFLFQATHQQHLLRIIGALKGIEEAQGDAEHALAVEEFAEAAKAKRGYDVEQHPEYLVFEFANDLLLRPEQLQSLARLQKMGRSSFHELGAAIEMIMGGGKTKVLLPMTALQDADGEKIAISVMPKSLISSMSEELADRFWQASRQIDVISIARETELDLSNLLKRLQSARREKKAVLMTSSSVQSLFLKSIEAFARKDHQEIQRYRIIFEELRKSGSVTLDEMDLILDVLKSHHFTLGAPKPLKPEIISTVSDLYLLFQESPALRSELNVSFLSSKTGKPFTPAHYQEKIQPLLIEELLKGDFSYSNLELKAFLQSLKPQEKEWIRDYLFETPNPEAFTFVDHLSSMPLKNCLAILKEEASQLLPLTMKKQVDEHYGALPEGAPTSQSKWLAIPYHGSNNPAKNSMFGTELEILNYSTQAHLAKGVPISMLEEEILNLRKATIDFMKKHPKANVEKSEPYLAFQRISEPLALDLFLISSDQKKKLLTHINAHPKVQMELIRRHVLQEVKKSPEQLNTNAQIFSMLFKSVKGFTGTMWNAETFPTAFNQFFFSDTDVKTLTLLAEKAMHSSPKILDKSIDSREDISFALEKIFKGHPRGSLADGGGIFRNFDNSLVAKELLDQQEENGYQGIVFYDKSDQLMIFEKDKADPIPFTQSDLPKNKIAAYWDQLHTTGSDLKLSLEMHAVATFSRHTFLRDILQTVWRLRKLDKGQTISFALPKEDAEVIAATLEKLNGRDPKLEIQLGDLLLFALFNQSQRQGNDNFRALKQKLQNILIDPLLEIFSDSSIHSREAADIFDATRDLFISSTEENPYEAIGHRKETALSHSVVKETLDKILTSNPFQAFRTHPFLKGRFDAVEMEKRMREIAAREEMFLPEKLVRVERYENENEIESERAKEKENENQQEEDQEQQAFVDEGNYLAHPVFNWGPPQFADIPIRKGEDFLAAPLDNLGNAPLFPFRDALALYSKTLPSADAFDPDLLTTLNFSPIHLKDRRETTKQNSPYPPYEPLGLYQDSSQNLLLIQDRKTSRLQAAMIDLDDANQLAKWLETDRKKPIHGKRDFRLSLYHLENGIYREGSDPIDPQILESDAFLRLKVQAKFLNGDVSYSETELPVLKKWIEEQGVEKMRDFFKNQILAFKPTSKKEYRLSEIRNTIFLEEKPFS